VNAVTRTSASIHASIDMQLVAARIVALLAASSLQEHLFCHGWSGIDTIDGTIQAKL
jgi:hypothetical protein